MVLCTIKYNKKGSSKVISELGRIDFTTSGTPNVTSGPQADEWSMTCLLIGIELLAFDSVSGEYR
jgi:hypothetical protein